MARILVVDDDELFVKLMVLALKQRGHDVEYALDGDAGCATFAGSHFDAVVCDILMPEKEGIETIQDIRRARSDVGIVAISGGLYLGSTTNIDVLGVIEKLGADITIKKPFQMPVLCKAVEDAIALHNTPSAAARG